MLNSTMKFNLINLMFLFSMALTGCNFATPQAMPPTSIPPTATVVIVTPTESKSLDLDSITSVKSKDLDSVTPVKSKDLDSVTPIPSPTPKFMERLSQWQGQQGNGDSYELSLSAEARWAAFTSRSDNWLPGDTASCQVQDKTVSCTDIFWLDRQTAELKRLSVASDGNTANHDSFSPTISADGQWVVFVSQADNLVADDSNEASDIFLHHVPSGLTRRMSVSSDGTESNGRSFAPSMSPDGRWILFASEGDNLVFGDSNRQADVFLYDNETGQLQRVSVTAEGRQSWQNSWPLAMSADGQLVVFGAGGALTDELNRADGGLFMYRQTTKSTEQVVKDASGLGIFAASLSADGRWLAYQMFTEHWDIMLQDLSTGTRQQGNVSSGAVPANFDSFAPVISADGQKLLFSSRATNLVAADTHGQDALFEHDLASGQTKLISRNEQGEAANGLSELPTISANGQWIAFTSKATNLVAGDNNGHGDIFLQRAGTRKDEKVEGRESVETGHALSLPIISQTRNLTLNYEIEDVKISPNGETLAVAGGGVTALYSLPHLELLRYIPTDYAASITWAPDNYRIATAKYNGAVPVWASDTAGKLNLLGVLLKEDDLGKPWQPMARWSPDGEFVVSNSIDEKVYVWRVLSATAEIVLNVDGAKGVTGLAWSPDGRQIMVSDRLAVRLWDVILGQSRLIFPTSAYSLTNLAWSADGQYVAFGSHNEATGQNLVHLWQPKIGLAVLEGYPAKIWSVAWSPHDELAVAGEAGVWVWNEVETGHALSLLEPTMPVIALDWSADGKYLVTGTAEGVVTLIQGLGD